MKKLESVLFSAAAAAISTARAAVTAAAFGRAAFRIGTADALLAIFLRFPDVKRSGAHNYNQNRKNEIIVHR